ELHDGHVVPGPLVITGERGVGYRGLRPQRVPPLVQKVPQPFFLFLGGVELDHLTDAHGNPLFSPGYPTPLHSDIDMQGEMSQRSAWNPTAGSVDGGRLAGGASRGKTEEHEIAVGVRDHALTAAEVEGVPVTVVAD